MKPGTLYVVSTPIGNLEDITLRAIRILKEVDLIACEDTRRAQILCKRYEISKPLISFYSYNAARRTQELIKCLHDGKDIALISDSGTPGISDPGSMLINECIHGGINLTVIPGPTAFVAALVLSGRPTHKFIFEGFLSNKSARRRRRLEELKGEERTVIVYESPHRLIKFLEDYLDIMGDREVAVIRELTKKFEEVRRDKVSGHVAHFQANKARGEFIVVW